MKNLCLIFALMFGVMALIVSPSYGQKAQTAGGSDAFLNKAIEMNQNEVDLSRMAQGKAEDPRVKEFAEMMVQDHTQALEKLRSQAGLSEAQVPLSKQHQMLSDKLSKLTGAQFDTEYMNAMVSDHRQAVQSFEREAGTGNPNTPTKRQKPGADTKMSDAAIAREMLPTLQKHLSEAEQITKTMGETSPAK